jgi:hypothetical protein
MNVIKSNLSFELNSLRVFTETFSLFLVFAISMDCGDGSIPQASHPFCLANNKKKPHPVPTSRSLPNLFFFLRNLLFLNKAGFYFH